MKTKVKRLSRAGLVARAISVGVLAATVISPAYGADTNPVVPITVSYTHLTLPTIYSV